MSFDDDVEIRRLNGAGETPTDITDLINRVARVDSASPGLANGIDVPEVADPVVRSYWWIVRLYAATAPTTWVEDIEFYTDGVNSFLADVGGSGLTVKVATSDVYDTPSDDELTVANYGNGVDDLDGAPVDVFTYVVDTGSRLSLGAGPYLGADPPSEPNPQTGYFGKYLILQVTTDDPAKVALVNPEQFSWTAKES